MAVQVRGKSLVFEGAPIVLEPKRSYVQRKEAERKAATAARIAAAAAAPPKQAEPAAAAAAADVKPPVKPESAAVGDAVSEKKEEAASAGPGPSGEADGSAPMETEVDYFAQNPPPPIQPPSQPPPQPAASSPFSAHSPGCPSTLECFLDCLSGRCNTNFLQRLASIYSERRFRV